MKFLSFLFAICLACFVPRVDAAPESRTWTPSQGAPFTGIVVNTSPDAVTVKRLPDGQVFRLKLSECNSVDQVYVAQIQKEAREAESIDARLSGEITWRLPPWNNLSWSNSQSAELWIWDEKTRSPIEKIATLKVDYANSSKRNEFFGTYKSDGPVHLWKPAKYVIKARFRANVNGEDKNLEQISTPMVLPAPGKDGINLNIVRFSLTR